MMSVDQPVERTFGWENMFVPPDEDPRPQDPVAGGERETLLDYLGSYRLTLEMKCAGLDPEQLARRSVPPSDLSLLGLVRHLADVERHWFRRVLAGEGTRHIFRTEDDRDAAFEGAVGDAAAVEAAWTAWRGEVAFAERFVEGAPSLDVSGEMADGKRITLREVLVHMLEEYARHCGHADLLRERIDGRVGQ